LKFWNDRKGCAFPSYDTLADIAGCKRRAAIYSVKFLRRRWGFIVEVRRGRGNSNAIVPPWGRSAPADETAKRKQRHDATVSILKKVHRGAEKRCTAVPEKVHRDAPYLSYTDLKDCSYAERQVETPTPDQTSEQLGAEAQAEARQGEPPDWQRALRPRHPKWRPSPEQLRAVGNDLRSRTDPIEQLRVRYRILAGVDNFIRIDAEARRVPPGDRLRFWERALEAIPTKADEAMPTIVPAAMPKADEAMPTIVPVATPTKANEAMPTIVATAMPNKAEEPTKTQAA
jgi:hypothetical protein